MGVLQRYDEGPRNDLVTDLELHGNSPVPKYLLVLTCSLCALVAYHVFGFNIFKCKMHRSYWHHKSAEVLRKYMYKMALFHVLTVLCLGLIHHTVYKINRDPDSIYVECFQPFSNRVFVLLTLVAAIAISIVRFMSVSFVQADIQTTSDGHQIFKPGVSLNVKSLGFNTNSGGFRLVINPFMAICTVGLIILIMVLYGAFSHNTAESLMDYKICFKSWHQEKANKDLVHFREATRVVLIIVEFILPVLTVLGVEHVIYLFTSVNMKMSQKQQAMAYFVVLNSPFVNVNLVSTWSGWLVLSTLTHFLLGATGSYLLFFQMLYLFFDAACLLLLSILTSWKNKILSA